MKVDKINPYESPQTELEKGDGNARRRFVAMRAFVFSLVALGIVFLVPLFGFLFAPESFAGGQASQNIITGCMFAVFALGCVANAVALALGNPALKAASIAVAVLNAAILTRMMGGLSQLIKNAVN